MSNLPLPLGDVGVTGELYRFSVDFRGDPVGGKPIRPENHVGTVTKIILGGMAVTRRPGRAETSSTEGMIGVPNDGVMPAKGDRLVIDDVVYQVGPSQWSHRSSLVPNFDFGYTWFDVNAVV